MLLKKFIGKPYAGKPHVRFDEGAGKVILSFLLYSTGNYLFDNILIRMSSYIKELMNPEEAKQSKPLPHR